MIVGYLSVSQVMALHADQLRLYGGAAGVRDKGALESALARPAMTFGGEDLYEDIASKAAAMMHSLALNHPFVDGNKRVAAQAAIVFVELNGWEFLATPAELVEITLAVAEGKVAIEALAIWFRQRLRTSE
ncbi:MAG TPA: type II toxin-antitoxin system death-on-curing family toxin [Vicinamibacterales bacterium]|nr:type II toxin-antitoxin system death-on-curing family toxin [Vicinamibacterales bacterium]